LVASGALSSMHAVSATAPRAVPATAAEVVIMVRRLGAVLDGGFCAVIPGHTSTAGSGFNQMLISFIRF
jgi:hypothetical protein